MSVGTETKVLKVHGENQGSGKDLEDLSRMR